MKNTTTRTLATTVGRRSFLKMGALSVAFGATQALLVETSQERQPRKRYKILSPEVKP